MAETEARRIGVSFDVKPHAYDPATQPEYFEGVLSRRAMAFLIDVVMIGLPVLFASLFILVFGLLTLGLGWMLYAIIAPLVAICYIWTTLGGQKQATVGMRMMGIRLDRLDGRPVDGLLAVVHSVLFWAGNAILTPLVLLVSLFADRKRTLHDLLLGTVVTRSDV